ncbi:MAG: lipid-binding SYLF domain-containing protein [Vicinamibacterales bacterium]
MSLTRVVTTAALALAVVAVPIAQEDRREAERLTDAIAVLDEVMGAGDSAVPRSIMERAEAIAVFPSLVKAGFVVGGSRGHGAISVRHPETGAWSSPGFLTITGGSVGFQIGAQAVDLILVVQNRRGLNQLLRNQFKIGADAAVAAGPVGRDASASTDIQLRAQILSYSRTRGIFAGITLNGSTIRQDRDANERFYGVAYRTTTIVNDGRGGAPEPVPAWKAALVRHAGGTS